MIHFQLKSTDGNPNMNNVLNYDGFYSTILILQVQNESGLELNDFAAISGYSTEFS